jgi:hypothetical protein
VHEVARIFHTADFHPIEFSCSGVNGSVMTMCVNAGTCLRLSCGIKCE